MLLVVCCTRDAGNNSEHGAQSIVDAVNRIRHPTSTPAMPAFAFQDRVEHSARTKLRHHCVQSASMRFFLQSAFAQKILYVVLAGEGPISLITKLRDRKSTRLNSSHSQISYAVFCLKKK